MRSIWLESLLDTIFSLQQSRQMCSVPFLFRSKNKERSHHVCMCLEIFCWSVLLVSLFFTNSSVRGPVRHKAKCANRLVTLSSLMQLFDVNIYSKFSLHLDWNYKHSSNHCFQHKSYLWKKGIFCTHSTLVTRFFDVPLDMTCCFCLAIYVYPAEHNQNCAYKTDFEEGNVTCHDSVLFNFLIWKLFCGLCSPMCITSANSSVRAIFVLLV